MLEKISVRRDLHKLSIAFPFCWLQRQSLILISFRQDSQLHPPLVLRAHLLFTEKALVRSNRWVEDRGKLGIVEGGELRKREFLATPFPRPPSALLLASNRDLMQNMTVTERGF